MKQLSMPIKIAGGVLLSIILLFSGLLIYLSSLDFNDYKPEIQQIVQESTGRTLAIDGDINVHASLHPSLRIEGIHLSNVKGGSRDNMINITKIEVHLALMPLLSGTLQVKQVVLIEPDILLEQLDEKTNNWTFAAKESEGEAAKETEDSSESSEPMVLPEVHHVLIRDARLIYRQPGAKEMLLEVASIELNQQALDQPLNFAVEGAWQKQPIKLSGNIQNVPALLANETTPLELQLALANLTASLSGQIDKPMTAEGIKLNVVLDTPNLSATARALDVELKQQLPLHLQALLQGKADQFTLGDLQLKLGESDLSGQLAVDVSKSRPAIKGKLVSKQMDVSPWMEKSEADKKEAEPAAQDKNKAPKAKKKEKPKVFPADELDLAALKSADAELSYRAAQLKLPDMVFKPFKVVMSLNNGHLRVKPFETEIAGGSIHVSLDLKPQTTTNVMELDVKVAGVQPGQLLANQKEKMIEGAPVDATIHFSGQGTSIAKIMAVSNGKMLVQLGKGKIKSGAMRLVGGDLVMNLVNSLNPFSDKIDYNELKCGVVHFRIKNGEMVTNDGIAFETDRMNIISDGDINLASEEIDLSISTEPREGLGINISNMVNVVKLGGTLAEPGIAMDVAKTGMAAARTAGAIATGGLSLLGESLINRATADSTPCQTALKMK